jgi:hypothetical protein
MRVLGTEIPHWWGSVRIRNGGKFIIACVDDEGPNMVKPSVWVAYAILGRRRYSAKVPFNSVVKLAGLLRILDCTKLSGDEAVLRRGRACRTVLRCPPV